MKKKKTYERPVARVEHIKIATAVLQGSLSDFDVHVEIEE